MSSKHGVVRTFHFHHKLFIKFDKLNQIQKVVMWSQVMIFNKSFEEIYIDFNFIIELLMLKCLFYCHKFPKHQMSSNHGVVQTIHFHHKHFIKFDNFNQIQKAVMWSQVMMFDKSFEEIYVDFNFIMGLLMLSQSLPDIF